MDLRVHLEGRVCLEHANPATWNERGIDVPDGTIDIWQDTETEGDDGSVGGTAEIAPRQIGGMN